MRAKIGDLAVAKFDDGDEIDPKVCLVIERCKSRPNDMGKCSDLFKFVYFDGHRIVTGKLPISRLRAVAPLRGAYQANKWNLADLTVAKVIDVELVD